MEAANKYDLEDRLVNYACIMIDIVDALPKTKAATYISAQLIRSCQSPAFNYGEAQAAESRDDFIHKLSVVLKELKECRTALKIVKAKEMIQTVKLIETALQETEELIAIIGKSISTAERNR